MFFRIRGRDEGKKIVYLFLFFFFKRNLRASPWSVL